MFDVANWLLCLCLTHSMCACTQWLICCVLAHEALLSNTRYLLLPIVVVLIAFAQCDMKMPCACTQGLVVDICHRHCRLLWSLLPLRDTMWICSALVHKASSSNTRRTLLPLLKLSSPSHDVMCQQLVSLCMLLLQYEACAHVLVTIPAKSHYR